MAMFLLTTINDTDRLAEVIGAQFGHEALRISETGSWLISFPGTTMELSALLGITDGSNGTGIIVSVGSYYGRAPTDIWEWMKSRMERN